MLSDEQIRTEIFTFHAYYPYWKIKRIWRNPKFDDNSRRILNLKNEKETHHSSAVQHYKAQLCSFIRNNIGLQRKVLAGAFVPSHDARKASVGLSALVQYMAAEFAFQFLANPLVRHTTVAKLADGGDRDKDVHLNSIAVTPNSLPAGAFVILLDDVTTTGNSIWACEDLLRDAGASAVLKIALSKTDNA